MEKYYARVTRINGRIISAFVLFFFFVKRAERRTPALKFRIENRFCFYRYVNINSKNENTEQNVVLLNLSI